MIPESNRRIMMNKMVINNNNTNNCTNNFNIIFVKIKTSNTANCPNVQPSTETSQNDLKYKIWL
jgi:hypothetical protein